MDSFLERNLKINVNSAMIYEIVEKYLKKRAGFWSGHMLWSSFVKAALHN